MICPDKMTSSSLFQQPLHILKLPPACSATSRHFHLSPHYVDHMVTMHTSLDKANLNKVNISTPDFCIWQHFDSNLTTAYMQKLWTYLRTLSTALQVYDWPELAYPTI